MMSLKQIPISVAVTAGQIYTMQMNVALFTTPLPSLAPSVLG